MPIGLPLGRPHNSPSALTKQTRSLYRSHTLLEESWTQNPGQGPHRRMPTQGSPLKGVPLRGRQLSSKRRSPGLAAHRHLFKPQLIGSETPDKYFPLGLRFLICVTGIMLQGC